MSRFTIVERLSDQMDYHCGYCSKSSACASGMWAHAMNSLDYQSLIDRGWRRSGKYCYKPIMDKTCCPQYTIRCKALEYTPSKSKKKVLKKMRQFLLTEGDDELVRWKEKHSDNSITKCGSTKVSQCSLAEGGTRVEMSSHSPCERAVRDTMESKMKKEVQKGLGPDPTKPRCKKAKALRLERRNQKKNKQESGDSLDLQPAKSAPENQYTAYTLPHLDQTIDYKRKLEVRTVRASVDDDEFQRSKAESHAVYQKYQEAIHGDSPFECTEKQWIRFLVDSPLNRDTDGPGPGYGNHHQQYILDGKIIAVGVIDILPNCVSSVYLYYDPDYGFLSLGVYTALSEIMYTRKLQKESQQLEYYYMGFYIHSCPKMCYKRAYHPSFLLCPETYEWVPIQLCLDTLDKKKYSRLNILNEGSATSTDEQKGNDSDIDSIGILYRRTPMNFQQYSRLNYSAAYRSGSNSISTLLKAEMEAELADLKEYVSIVGTICAKRMLLYREHEI